MLLHSHRDNSTTISKYHVRITIPTTFNGVQHTNANMNL